MARLSLFVAGAVLLVIFGNGLSRRLAYPVWPTAEDDQALLTRVHSEMREDYGDAWGRHTWMVLKTNAPLYHEMMESFEQRLQRHSGLER